MMGLDLHGQSLSEFMLVYFPVAITSFVSGILLRKLNVFVCLLRTSMN